MKDLELNRKDFQLRKTFDEIAKQSVLACNESQEEIFQHVTNLPRYISIHKNDTYDDYIFTVFKIENDGHQDAYTAMFARECIKQNRIVNFSTVNFLFSVSASSFTKVLSKFYYIYKHLSKIGVIKGRNWLCKYKNLNFSTDDCVVP